MPTFWVELWVPQHWQTFQLTFNAVLGRRPASRTPFRNIATRPVVKRNADEPEMVSYGSFQTTIDTTGGVGEY